MKKGLMFTALACALTMGIASCGNDNNTPAIVITVQSLRISGDFKTVYKVGEAFDSTGMIVTATFSNGQTADIPAGGYTLDVPDMSTAGTKTVTVTCQGVTAKVTITVEPETYTVTIENKDKFADPWKVGDYESLSIRIPGVKPGDAIASGELVITSSDQSVAKTEEKSVVITAVGEGTATITATFRGQYSDSVEITVEKAAIYRMVNNPVAEKSYFLAHRNEKNPNALVFTSNSVNSYYFLRYESDVKNAAVATVRVLDTESEYKYAIDLTTGEGESAVTKTVGVAKTGYDRYPYALGIAGEKGSLNPKHGTGEFTPEEVAFKIDDQFRLVCQFDGKELVMGCQSGYDTTGVGEASGIANPAHLYFETEEEVPATAIDVEPESVTVQPGGVADIKVTLTPVDSTDLVEFKSANEQIATVDDTGKVAGVKAGSTTITVTAGSVSKEVPVTVEGEALNYGTRENPLTVAEAKALLDTLGADKTTEEPIYITGEVYSASYDSGFKNSEIWLKDAEGKKAFELYRAVPEDGDLDAFAAIAEGDTVSAFGLGVLFKGNTYELTTASSGSYTNPNVYNVVKGEIPALESVSLDKESITLASGQSYTLKVVPNPSRAELPAISWASSDPEVATVDQEGKVTAVKEGTATITVTVTGFDPLYCAVTVDDSGGGGESHDGSESSPFTPDEAIAKAEEQGTTASSETYWVTGTVKKIKTAWSSQYNNITLSLEASNDKVFDLYRLKCTEAQKDEIIEGRTVIVAKGNIINYSGNTPQLTAGCEIVSLDNPELVLESVALSETEVELALNQEKTLSVVPTPSGAALPNGITWESSDAETVSVANGLIKGLKAGSATITAHVPGFDDLTCAVTVAEEEIDYGTQENPLSVADAIALLDKLVPTQGTWTDEEVWVTGTVHDASYNSSFKSWTINLYNGEVEQAFQLYSAQLADGLDGNNLQDGAVVVAHGPAKIHTNGMHELAYNSTTKVSPQVTSIEYTKPSLTSVSLNKAELEVKEEATYQLEVIPNPAQADLPDGITWKSSDEEVATVSESGLVTGVKAGTATITASVPGFDDLTCAVTVVEKGEPGEETTLVDAQVSSMTPSSYVNNYGSEFTATVDGVTLTFSAINDGESTSGWTDWRLGRKANASTPTIQTSAISGQVNTINMEITKFNESGLKTAKLYISSDGTNFTEAVDFTSSLKLGTVSISLGDKAANGLCYKIVFDMDATGTTAGNGSIRFSGLSFIGLVA